MKAKKRAVGARSAPSEKRDAARATEAAKKEEQTAAPEGPAPARSRDRRPWVYAGLDAVFAILYLTVAFKLLPVTGASFRDASLLVAAGAVTAGAGTAARRPWGWWAGVVGSAVVLLTGVTVIILLVLAAAYLKGVYGAIGKSAALGSLLMAALAVEVYCLWPLFQLRYLLSADGRRTAGRAG